MKVTVELGRKCVPLMVKVCADAPTVMRAGESPLMAVRGVTTAKLTGAEAPPAGKGFVTTTG